jgi:hypothetical protein
MQRIRLSDLTDAVRSFFTGLNPGQSVVIEDDQGRLQYGVTPYSQATLEEKQRAWKDIERLQAKVGAAMQRAGVTEDDIMRVLLEDD